MKLSTDFTVLRNDEIILQFYENDINVLSYRKYWKIKLKFTYQNIKKIEFSISSLCYDAFRRKKSRQRLKIYKKGLEGEIKENWTTGGPHTISA